MSDSLSLLFTKERCEGFAQVAIYKHDKRATVSKSLSSFFKKKGVMSDSLVIRANLSQKEYAFDGFSLHFLFFMPKSESLSSLFAQMFFFNERREQIAPVALYKRATVSESHPSLFTTERLCVIRSDQS